MNRGDAGVERDLGVLLGNVRLRDAFDFVEFASFYVVDEAANRDLEN